MLKEEFINQLLKNWNYRILLFELILFSVILGAFPYMWPIACLIFVGLFIVLTRIKGLLYMVYILSAGWAFMATMGAYFIGGWGWGAGIGIFVMVSSLSIHFRDLRKPLYSQENKSEADDHFNWLLRRRQNLN